MISRFIKDHILFNKGPWGQGPSGDGPQKPWGNNGPRRPNNGPGIPDPDLEAVMRQAQDKFRNIFGGGDGGSSGGAPKGGSDFNEGKGIGLLLALLAVFWLATGLYRVEPQENAVILTFGKWTSTRTEPGLGYALPWPVQEVTKVDVAFDRRVEIGFRDQPGSRAAGNDVADESLMVTGDENIIDIDFVVLWRVGDAGKFLFQIRDPETTVKKAAESAVREVVGRTPIQKALTEARAQIEADTKTLMQKMLDDYHSGVVINSVQLLKVDPPTEVVDAFNDVQRARADRERMKNEAETYRNDILPRARGEAQKLIQDAEAYKLAVLSKAQGEADRFTSVLAAYQQARDVTQKRMYIETMQEIMSTSRKMVVSDGRGQSVLPYLPLDQLKPGAPKNDVKPIGKSAVNMPPQPTSATR